MKADFIKERIENEDMPRFLRCLTGWEAVVFELEDEPEEAPPAQSDWS